MSHDGVGDAHHHRHGHEHVDQRPGQRQQLLDRRLVLLVQRLQGRRVGTGGLEQAADMGAVHGDGEEQEEEQEEGGFGSLCAAEVTPMTNCEEAQLVPRNTSRKSKRIHSFRSDSKTRRFQK